MSNIAQYRPSTVTIYSVGLLGGSIGIGLKKSGFAGRIIGLSSSRGIETALARGLIDEGYHYDDLPRIIERTDLLILCSPILTIAKTIETLGAMELPAKLLITDIGSTKRVIVDTARRCLPPHVRFIGGHPMAGSEKSGPDASDPHLFQNAVYVLTPTREDDRGTANGLAEFLHNYLKCRAMFLTPDVHDNIAAAVSHLPHIVASALVLHAQKQEERVPGTLSLAASGFRDTTRIASAHYDIWHDIFSTNKEAVIPLIESYIDTLNDLKTRLMNDTLRDSFEAARKIRDSIVARN